jgi:hypothetical protein
VHPELSPSCAAVRAYRRVGRLANFELLVELSCTPLRSRETRGFWVPYVDVLAHPHVAEALRRSGWHVGRHVDVYSDEEAYDREDSDEELGHGQVPRRVGTPHPIGRGR